MRLDEFAAENGIAIEPVDRFDGFTVQIELPRDWEAYHSESGVRIWACRTDPLSDQFCPNAVLTMHRVAAALNPDEVFDMVTDQQLHSVPGAQEVHREFPVPVEGVGTVGVFALQIDHELGIIDSVAHSRIITAKDAILIAQLTKTMLHNSSVDRSANSMTIRANTDVPEPGSALGAPV